MARTARAAVGGGIYHVLNRGNGRMRIFRKSGDYLAFCELLLGCREKRRGCQHENEGGCHLFWSPSSTESSSVIACPPELSTTDWQAYVVPMVEVVDGIRQQWGPSGVTATEDLKQQRADNSLADAWNGGDLFAVIPVPTPITPVSPWW